MASRSRSASRQAGIYTRLSQDPDGTETTTGRQEDDCRKLCQSRGWKVVTVYRDSDLSAYRKGVRRPDFERMIADIEAGAIDVVVVWRSDRLARQPRDLERLLDVAEPRQVALVSCTEPFDSNGMGLFMLRTFVNHANLESAVKSERIRRKNIELAQAGKISGGGTRPFGFEADRVTVNSKEVPLIQEAARRVLAGESLRGVAADWNTRGVKTPTGGEWRSHVLRRLLMSGRIAGLREHGVKDRTRPVATYKAVWPAIISEDDHEQLKAILSDPRRLKNGGSPARKYLLTGMAFCGLCGSKLVARPRDDGRRCYVCASGPDFGGCGKIRSLAEPLEELVAQWVLTAIESPALGRALARQEKRGASTNGELKQLRDDERALERLAQDYYVDRRIGRAEFFATREALETRIAAVRRRVANGTKQRALATAASLGAQVRGEWDRAELHQRRAIVSAIVERVVVRPAVRGRNRFDPSRVEVVWRI